MNWDNISVVFNERQSGKTTYIMDQIHDLSLQNRTGEVLVVVSNVRQVEWWLRAWRDRYNAQACPRVISITNSLPVRGRRFEKVYVEDIEAQDEGIYDDKMYDISLCLREARDPEIVFTCSPTPFSYEPLHEQQARQAREAEDARLRAVEARQARRRFLDEVILRSIASTGTMPKLPDEILNGGRDEESGTD